MISLADITTEWRNHPHSNFAPVRSSDKKSLLPAPSSNGRGKGRMDIALSPPENGPRNPRHGSPRHVAISQNGLANGSNNLPHNRPVLNRQIAGKLLLDRHPDIVRDQSGTGSEADGRIGPSRLDHRLTTFFGPKLRRGHEGSQPRTLGEYQRADRSNYPIGRVSLGSLC